jgi:OOP family OmpA-OmpF porin
MHNKFTSGLLFALILFSHLPAWADGFYVSGSGGGTILAKAENKASGFFILDSEYDNGWNAGGALGYDFGMIRTELETAYRENNVDKLTTLGIRTPTKGNVSAWSYLFNVFYDFENSESFTPYVGFGLGAAKVSFNNVRTAVATFADDEDTVFAYKIALGAAFEVNKVIDLTFDYTFFGTANPDFTDATGLDFDSEYKSHSFNGGFRFNF